MAMTTTTTTTVPPNENLGPAPALLPALSTRVKSHTYSFHGNGRVFCDETNDRTTYEPDIARYLPRLSKTGTGTLAPRQPYIEKKGARWWKAQAGFRGLRVSGTVAVLRERISAYIERRGGGGLSGEIEAVRMAMEAEYDAANAVEVEERWGRADCEEEKAELWPRRFLWEALFQGGKEDKVVVVEVGHWGSRIEEAARALGVSCEMRKMPQHDTGRRLVVLGRSQEAVRARFAEVDREAGRAMARAKEEREMREQKARREFERRFELAKRRTKEKGNRQRKGKGTGSSTEEEWDEEWDVSGEWDISCPYMEEQWGSSLGDGNGCSLSIKLTKPAVQTGLVQIYADLCFIVVKGIMRFVNSDGAPRIDPKGRGKKKGGSSRKRDYPSDDDSDDDSDEDDDEYASHSRASNQTSSFLFPPTSLPSTHSRNFNFRWRGEETGEGEIQLHSDKKLCSLTWESPNALTGIFISDVAGRTEFTGVKKSFRMETSLAGANAPEPKPVYGSDPTYAWESLYEDEYESARVNRWR